MVLCYRLGLNHDRWPLEWGIFGCFVDTELPTALFCVSQRESGVLGNLSYMTPKDFPGNGDDSLTIQMMERAVLSTLCRSLLQLEQAWN